MSRSIIRGSTGARPSAFGSEYLLFVLGASLQVVHALDDVFIVGDVFPPPFWPLMMGVVLYVFLPTLVRGLMAAIFGLSFAVAQVPGHFLPAISDGGLSASNADYTALLSEAGGILLVVLGVRLIRSWARGCATSGPGITQERGDAARGALRKT